MLYIDFYIEKKFEGGYQHFFLILNKFAQKGQFSVF